MLTPVLALALAVAAQVVYSQVILQQVEWAVVRADDLFVVVVTLRAVAAYSFVVGLRRTGAARAAVVDHGRGAGRRRRDGPAHRRPCAGRCRTPAWSWCR